MNTDNLKRSARLTAVVALLLASAACNTVQGVGKDIQKSGEALEDVADGKDK